MKQLCILALCAPLIGCMDLDTSSSTESDAVSVASFSYSPAAPQHVGAPVAFDATATACGTATCNYHWQWWWPSMIGGSFNGWKRGGQMGDGPVITYTFDAFAATKPYVLVQLKVTETGPVPRIKPVYQASATFVVEP